MAPTVRVVLPLSPRPHPPACTTKKTSPPVPPLQILTVERAMQMRERAVQLTARRDDAFKRAAREEDTGRQGSLDL